MRKLILFLVIILGFLKSGLTQTNVDPRVTLYWLLFSENDSLEKELDRLSSSLKKVRTMLDKEKKDNFTTKQNYSILNEEYSRARSRLLQNDELILSLRKTLIENSYLLDSVTKKSIYFKIEAEKYKSDLENVIKENSLFKNVELGYKDGKNIVFKKKNGLQEHGGYKEELNYLNYFGTLYQKKNDHKDIEPGKIVIYVDGKLYTQIEDTLRKVHRLHKNYYDLFEISSLKRLEVGLPEKKEYKIGFISNELYDYISPNAFEYYWTAFDNGIFSISSDSKSISRASLMPDFVENRKTLKKETITTSSKQIQVFFSDYGQDDNDVISVKLNEDWILSEERITRAEQFQYIALKQNTTNYLLLFADEIGREGTPCTLRVRIVFEDGSERTVELRSKLNESQYIEIINNAE